MNATANSECSLSEWKEAKTTCRLNDGHANACRQLQQQQQHQHRQQQQQQQIEATIKSSLCTLSPALSCLIVFVFLPAVFNCIPFCMLAGVRAHVCVCAFSPLRLLFCFCILQRARKKSMAGRTKHVFVFACSESSLRSLACAHFARPLAHTCTLALSLYPCCWWRSRKFVEKSTKPSSTGDISVVSTAAVNERVHVD